MIMALGIIQQQIETIYRQESRRIFRPRVGSRGSVHGDTVSQGVVRSNVSRDAPREARRSPSRAHTAQLPARRRPLRAQFGIAPGAELG